MGVDGTVKGESSATPREDTTVMTVSWTVPQEEDAVPRRRRGHSAT